jgi:hypothetical protein
MLFLFTKYHSLTHLSFESFHIGLVREMFTPRQSTVNEVTRGIRRSMLMMLCGLLSNLLWVRVKLNPKFLKNFIFVSCAYIYFCYEIYIRRRCGVLCCFYMPTNFFKFGQCYKAAEKNRKSASCDCYTGTI